LAKDELLIAGCKTMKVIGILFFSSNSITPRLTYLMFYVILTLLEYIWFIMSVRSSVVRNIHSLFLHFKELTDFNQFYVCGVQVCIYCSKLYYKIRYTAELIIATNCTLFATLQTNDNLNLNIFLKIFHTKILNFIM
jgi:hypothetical protein